MDVSGFKGFIQKLIEPVRVFKDYSSLVVPGVLVLVAVLVFIPTQLISTKLNKQVKNKSISIGREIRSLSKDVTPRNQWKVEQQYQQTHGSDANQISLLAQQTTKRELLSYRVFPKPKEESIQTFDEFGRQFREAIEQLISRVNAHDCPTQAELDKSLLGTSSSGYRTDRRGAYRGLKETEATILDELCRARAESASVYANLTDLSGYEFWEEYRYTDLDEGIRDCWYWQLGYWIMEDVVDTIGVLNTGSSSVFTSPVKRLLRVSFGGDKEGFRSRERTVGGRPSYVRQGKEERMIEAALTEPWTGRVCNEDIDVVHFKVGLVVSARAVLPFMQELCSAKQHEFGGFFGEQQRQPFKHNQITILESEITPIDREDESHELYRYGEDAVVELDLICEYIFDKDGYDEIKPELVRATGLSDDEMVGR
jgi:hypothetical protein